MFGFISKLREEFTQRVATVKNDIDVGFDAVHQRLVTLEAKVEALFNHNTVVEAAKADVAKVETVAEDAEKTAEDVKDAS